MQPTTEGTAEPARAAAPPPPPVPPPPPLSPAAASALTPEQSALYGASLLSSSLSVLQSLVQQTSALAQTVSALQHGTATHTDGRRAPDGIWINEPKRADMIVYEDDPSGRQEQKEDEYGDPVYDDAGDPVMVTVQVETRVADPNGAILEPVDQSKYRLPSTVGKQLNTVPMRAEHTSQS